MDKNTAPIKGAESFDFRTIWNMGYGVLLWL
jgi:hypothetical protein